jgi:abhydrolase domain-containing protein 6
MSDEPSRVLAALGGYLLRGAVHSGRRLLRASVEIHRDDKGRETPCLIVGKPRRGTLVFLHGFGDRADSFLPTARLLYEDFRIIVPAMPGFAGGWLDPSELHSFAAYARWLGDLLLQVAPERFHLMGNSLGGASALGIATRMPERLASLTLVDTAGVRVPGVSSFYDEIESGHNLFEVRSRAAYRRFAERVFAKPPPFPRPITEHLYSEQVRNADWYSRIIADLHVDSRLSRTEKSAVVELAGLHVPTLVVWGEHDSLFPLAIGEHAAAAIPNAELHTLRGVGHVPHLESPKRLAHAFGAFARTKN